MMKRTTQPSLFPTLFTASLVTLALVQPHAGFLVVLLMAMLLVRLLSSLTKRSVKAAGVSNLLARSLVWLVAVATVIAVHYNRAIVTRTNADEVVATISGYSARHGGCPDTLDEVGVSEQALDAKIGSSGYMCANGKPAFFYVAPFIIRDRYVYDFEQGHWSYQSSLLRWLNSV